MAIKQLHSQVVDEETLEDFRKEIKIMVYVPFLCFTPPFLSPVLTL